jgi:hypothetical protein
VPRGRIDHSLDPPSPFGQSPAPANRGRASRSPDGAAVFGRGRHHLDNALAAAAMIYGHDASVLEELRAKATTFD